MGYQSAPGAKISCRATDKTSVCDAGRAEMTATAMQNKEEGLEDSFFV